MNTEKELPNHMETDEAWDLWEDFLLSCDKEDLVQIMLSKMSSDQHFLKMVHCQFSSSNSENNLAEEKIRYYVHQIDEEMLERDPDCEYMVSVTERFFQNIESMQKTADKIKAYVTIIKRLDDAVANGAGYEDENEDLLFEAISDAVKFAIDMINEKDITKELKEVLCEYVEMEKRDYDPVADDFLQVILEHI